MQLQIIQTHWKEKGLKQSELLWKVFFFFFFSSKTDICEDLSEYIIVFLHSPLQTLRMTFLAFTIKQIPKVVSEKAVLEVLYLCSDVKVQTAINSTVCHLKSSSTINNVCDATVYVFLETNQTETCRKHITTREAIVFLWHSAPDSHSSPAPRVVFIRNSFSFSAHVSLLFHYLHMMDSCACSPNPPHCFVQKDFPRQF